MSTEDLIDEDAIAVIGMACRFPGSDNVDKFWDNLRNGASGLTFYSDDFLRKRGRSEEELSDPNFVNCGAFIEDIDKFDAEFFGFSPKEAEITSPQQRIILECSYNALQDAGYSSEKYDGEIGVFTGVGPNTYYHQNIQSNPEIEGKLGRKTIQFGNDVAFSATQISYKMNLKGPSINISTACSTSLVAVHMACNSLLSYECDMALCGGAQISVNHDKGYFYKDGGILSPDGLCRAFDEEARGTVSGNGAGVVLLKRLEDAIADRDNIYAVVLSSAINNDGNEKVGFTAPSIEGQATAIAKAHAMAGVGPKEIDFIEAHGTGTPLGDPIEMASLKQAYELQPATSSQSCAVGTLKSNLGHMGVAAGIGGFIKAVLSLKHRELPPTLNCKKPNPKLFLEDSPFFINTKLTSYKDKSGCLLAGVSSFGMGGTNAHAILREWNNEGKIQNSEGIKGGKEVILSISAKKSDSLRAQAKNLIAHLESTSDTLPNIAYTLNVGRDDHQYRRTVVTDNKSTAIDSLNKVINENEIYPCSKVDKTIFIFSGQGSQYKDMAKNMYKECHQFKAMIDRLAVITMANGFDLLEALLSDSESRKLDTDDTKHAQITLFCVQYAVAKLYINWGINPIAMVGHSIGEYVAACLSNVMTLEDAIKIVIIRAEVVSNTPAGCMISVECEKEELENYLTDDLDIAAYNSRDLIVVSGAKESVENFDKFLPNSISRSYINKTYGFHSRLMNKAKKEFKERAGNIKLSPPDTPYISNVTGTWVKDEEATNVDFWSDHISKTVNFKESLNLLGNDSELLYVDCGPSNIMASLIRRNIGPRAAVIGSFPKRKFSGDEHKSLLKALGQLWELGHSVDWGEFYKEDNYKRCRLPTYSYQKSSYWIYSDTDYKNKSTVSDYKSYESVRDKNEELYPRVYMPGWKQSLATRHGSNSSLSKVERTYLIIGNNNKKNKTICEILKKNNSVIVVGEEDECQSNNQQSISVNLLSEESVSSLFSRIINSESVSLGIIVDFTEGDSDHEKLEKLNKLLCLNKVAANQEKVNQYTINILGSNLCNITGYESIDPEMGSVASVCRVLNQEVVNAECRYIDVEDSCYENFISPSKSREHYLAVTNEIVRPVSVPVLAYRGSNRYVEDFTLSELPSELTSPCILKNKGTYIITGGMGGIGLEIAKFLSKEYMATLVLIGRSIPNLSEGAEGRVSESVSYMKSCGANVILKSVDVGDEESLRRAIDSVEAEIGSINGVVHAAGIPGGGLMQLKGIDEIKDVLNPKIKGTLNLLKILKNKNTDFMMLCSSQNSLKGRSGRGDYSAANAFLDSIALSNSESYPVISVNWCAWSEVGMAARLSDGQAKGSGIKGIGNRDGCEVFRSIVNMGYSRAVVSMLPIEESLSETRRKVFDDIDAIGRETVSNSRPSYISTKYEEPQTDVEQRLCIIWEDILGISPVGIKDNYFELGGDSLLLGQLLSLIKKDFEVHITLSEIMGSETLSCQAEMIMTKAIESLGTDEVSALIDELG